MPTTFRILNSFCASLEPKKAHCGCVDEDGEPVDYIDDDEETLDSFDSDLPPAA